MTMIVNNSPRTLKIGGVTLTPNAMEDVNMSAKDLKEHLFVRSGLIEVSGAKVSKAKTAKEDNESTTDGGEVQE